MTALRGLANVMAALLVWVLPLLWLSAGGAAAQTTCGALVTGTGGTVTHYNEGNQTFCVHTFTSNGTFTLTQPVTIDHLIVGGGGGGGAFTGGGGGGGGMLTGAGSRAAGTYNIVVGAGGAGDSRTTWPSTFAVTRGGQNGGVSSVFGIAAAGGGGGGTYNQGLGVGAGFNGGSGGGASFQGPVGQGIAGQGNNGATGTGFHFTGGGGGGAGQAGFNGTGTMAGRGGDGRVSSITGAPVTYAGGGAGGGDFRNGFVAPNVGGAGGGGASRNETAGESGTPGLGGGGAGSRSADWGVQSTGGNGGSGVVILRYVGNTAPVANAGADITVSAGATVSLNGGTSTDAQGNIISYAWSRVTGSSGTLSDENSAQASFATVAPTGPSQSFVFRLTVTDAFGLTSTDDVTVTVNAIETPNQPAASGGNRVYDYLDPATQRTFRVHVFETNGTFTLDREREIEYLIVGGGGGGGAIGGGGGGGGGMRSGTITRQPGETPFQIVVGAGGAGDTRVSWPGTVVLGGDNGGDSSVFGITATGGGGGGTYNTSSHVGLGRTGGSGGGSSVGGPGGSGTNGQGTNGGTGTGGGGDTTGGGGGGAAQVGSNGSVALAGRGGDGLVSTISGAVVTYAGGGAGGGDIRGNGAAPNGGGAGGGGASSNDAVGGAGAPGTGGGGAGGRAVDSGTQSTGGNGGSGVVILRYVVNNPPVASAGADATAFAGLVFALDGSATTDVDGATPSGNITTYLWEQINIPAGGTAVTLTGADTEQASFTPSQPANGTSEALTFRLTVTDSFGVQSTDDVTITLQAMADLVATKTARVFSQDGTGCGNLSASPPSEPALPAPIPGACIEYTISIENTGPVEATGIELTDNLPAEVTYVAAETAGWTEQTLTTVGNAVIVSDGVIAAGATGATAATITIRALVK
jgi:uncharacterized repeat protein (TIGR01451 family)